MRVLLVRHAVAEGQDPRGWADDSPRPLTNEGAAKYFLAARGLRKIVPDVEPDRRIPLG